MEFENLKKEREKTLQLIKNLQEDYFGKGVMPTASYKSNLATYKARLIQVEEQLRQMESKMHSEK